MVNDDMTIGIIRITVIPFADRRLVSLARNLSECVLDDFGTTGSFFRVCQGGEAWENLMIGNDMFS
ncbi:hypothetical protein M378DRAFT_637225 [Amanita muscaria Koide BX008]|uniref:Uncharacterized protein n=1 Tax=Amanita muscaria (strain Koide BX008) TaxID=946122 RepID=A0A0C2X4D9_AMAMK|nr:hypothetical protein M378DRAFT_637225 [Amanita muscaria Koide BX008]